MVGDGSASGGGGGRIREVYRETISEPCWEIMCFCLWIGGRGSRRACSSSACSVEWRIEDYCRRVWEAGYRTRERTEEEAVGGGFVDWWKR
jgi:hypothetical protein